MTRLLAGNVAIVTGAAHGLGQAVAYDLARHGTTVVGLDLAPMDETLKLLERVSRPGAASRVDVADEAAVDAAVDAVVERYARLDIVVNAAERGIEVARRPFWEVDAAELDALLTANVRSAFVVAKAASRPMREAGFGRIVNFTSAAVGFGMADQIPYVTAKSALVGLTRSMARELAPHGVTVNAVAPGLVPTDAGSEALSEAWLDDALERQLVAKAIEPRDVAAAVTYLCGPGGRMVTGQVLDVSAGSAMGPM